MIIIQRYFNTFIGTKKWVSKTELIAQRIFIIWELWLKKQTATHCILVQIL